MMYGATIVPIKGRYDDAFDLSVMATEKFGFYNRNTAFNPLTIEGKKSVSFELFSELGQQIPDRIFVPLGDGVVVSGVYKGFEDLLKLGIITRMPVVVAVQSEGSPNVVNNINSMEFVSTPSHTIADSISVDVPRNFYMTVDYLKEYAGEWTTVSDDEILRASSMLARSTGIFSEPAAVAAFAGMLKYHGADRIPAGTKNVVLLTGSGLKDLKSVQPSIRIPDAINPDMKEVEVYLNQVK
jgi:threonine synthase